MLSATSFNRSDRSDRSDLHQHLQQCAHARGRLHRLRGAFEDFDAVLAPRFGTTLGAMTVGVLALLVWLS
ncbi:MAG: hypothetical protein ABIR94_12095 [Rubrivivax sp.]